MIDVRPFQVDDLEQVVDLGASAWVPVHPSIEAAFTSDIYQVLVADPDGEQRRAIRTVCTTSGMEVAVATVDGELAGFVALDLGGAPTMAEIHMIAVDPASQRRGVADALMAFAERSAVEHGVQVLMVETGGDPGHAPARSLYSSAGYRHVPIARFFKRIG